MSGAVLLPTEPRRHVVDAGYYDNYGLELACNWLRELLERRQDVLQKHISGILLVQIRDNVSELSVNPESDARRESLREPSSTGGSRLLRALEGLSSPPAGLLAARESVMLFRNDSLLESLSHLYSSAFGEDFLTTTVFEFGGEASLMLAPGPGGGRIGRGSGELEGNPTEVGRDRILAARQRLLGHLVQRRPTGRST